MEDGAPSPCAKLTQSYRDLYTVPCFIWLPSSPDFNPIENIWNLLKTRLNARSPRPKGKEQVRIAVLEEWERISEKDISKFVDSMPQRIQTVIANHGEHTRW